jgi:hypothetical protein
MEIPKEVIKAAEQLTAKFGFNLVYLGEIEGQQYFNCSPSPSDNDNSGFPHVFIYEQKMGVLEITGIDALDILDRFPSD